MKVFEIKYKSKNTKARIGVLHTAHGIIETPVFMPPASKGYLKSLDTLDINNTKTQIILINAYHLFLNPGVHFIQKYGGIHSFMN
jgi:tRNA-guanine family transglycosylase